MVKKISSSYISNHQYFTARKDAYQLSNGVIVDPYFVVELPPSSCAVCITEHNEIILAEQYRYPAGRSFLELPGGFIDGNEKPEEGIARELLEETGYQFKTIIKLADTYANPGVLNNKTYLFLVLGGKKVSEQMLDANEEIKIILKSIVEVRAMLLQTDLIKQSMHALCLFYAFEYLKNNTSLLEK